MKGRGEHPIDVTQSRLRAVRALLDAAGLEYVSPEERVVLAGLQGRASCLAESLIIADAAASSCGEQPAKPLRLHLADMVARYALLQATTLDAMAKAAKSRGPA